MMRYTKLLSVAAALLLLSACNKKDVTVTVYDKTVTQQPIECLSLRVVPQDKNMTDVLNALYHFTPSCKQHLEVSYKSGIVCNSPYNAPQKTLTNFPSSYLNMEIRKGFKLQYSYYIDLDHKPTKEDIEEGLEQIKEDLKLSTQ